MAETRRKFDSDFREGAVRLVRETGKPIAQVARDLGVNAGTLGNWVNADQRRRGSDGVPVDGLGDVGRLVAHRVADVLDRDAVGAHGQMIFSMIIKSEDHASDLRVWVELRGFEPLTPSMRIQCSTGQTGQVTASAQVSGLCTVTITASEAA